MKFGRAVHESADETHHKHNIRSSGSQIHKTSHNLLIESAVNPHSISIFHNLESMNHRVVNWIALVHAEPFQHLLCVFLLTNKDAIWFLHHLNAKKVSHFSKITHIKLKHHGFLKLSEHNFIIPSKYKIIHIETHNQDLTSFSSLDEQSMFIVAFLKSFLHKIGLYTTIPSSRSLFKSIQSLFQSVHLLLIALLFIARRLFEKDFFT